MKINIDNINNYDEYDIYQFYNNIFSKLCLKYGYLISEEKIKALILEAIIDSKKSYIGDIEYGKYIKNQVIVSMDNEIKNSLNSDMQIKFINNYINKHFENVMNYKDSIECLNKLDYFLKLNDANLTPNVWIQLVKDNKLFFDAIEFIVNKYNKQIVSGNLEYIFDNYRIILIIESFCVVNNIEIKENNVDDFDIYTDSSDSVRLYLNEIGKIPLLTVDEEIELAKKIAAGDKLARDKFIESNLKLVVNVAKKYTGKGLPFLDLIQEGSAGLIVAVDRYDISYGCKFCTYAMWWIRQSIVRGIEEKSKNIRVPSYVYVKINEFRDVEREIELKYHRQATLKEIADEMGVSIKEVERLYQWQIDTLSLNKFVGEDEESEFGDFLFAEDDTSVEYEFMKSDVDRLLNSCNLKPREIEILKLRYGLSGETPMTLASIGEYMGLSRERIRQIEAKALKKIRASNLIKEFAIYMDNPTESLNKVNVRKQNISTYESKQNIYDDFRGYSKAEINLVLDSLTMSEKRLINLRYNSFPFALNQDDAYIFYTQLMPKIKRILLSNREASKQIIIKDSNNENQEEILINIVEKTDYVKLLDIIQRYEFNVMSHGLDYHEKAILILKFGAIDGKCFTDDAIAQCLRIDRSDVIRSSENILQFYKKNKFLNKEEVRKLLKRI